MTDAASEIAFAEVVAGDTFEDEVTISLMSSFVSSSFPSFSTCMPFRQTCKRCLRKLKCLNSVLNVKVLVGAFNQEKALVGAFSKYCTTLSNIAYMSALNCGAR